MSRSTGRYGVAASPWPSIPSSPAAAVVIAVHRSRPRSAGPAARRSPESPARRRSQSRHQHSIASVEDHPSRQPASSTRQRAVYSAIRCAPCAATRRPWPLNSAGQLRDGADLRQPRSRSGSTPTRCRWPRRPTCKLVERVGCSAAPLLVFRLATEPCRQDTSRCPSPGAGPLHSRAPDVSRSARAIKAAHRGCAADRPAGRPASSYLRPNVGGPSRSSPESSARHPRAAAPVSCRPPRTSTRRAPPGPSRDSVSTIGRSRPCASSPGPGGELPPTSHSVATTHVSRRSHGALYRAGHRAGPIRATAPGAHIHPTSGTAAHLSSRSLPHHRRPRRRSCLSEVPPQRTSPPTHNGPGRP